MHKIFIVMGKSATGKDTIFKQLLDNPELKLKSVIGYTTRPIRSGETNGVEYFFVSDDTLQELTESNKVIEHRAYPSMHGIWNYFTVDDGQIDLSESNYLFINTLEAYEQMKAYYGQEVVIPIYIEVEDGLRLKRALRREQKQAEPKYTELCRRFLADTEDFSEENIERLNIQRRYQNIDINICILQIINDIKIVINDSFSPI
jgi:guanylate kinase